MDLFRRVGKTQVLLITLTVVLVPLKCASKSKKCNTDIYIYLLHPCFAVVACQNVSCGKKAFGHVDDALFLICMKTSVTSRGSPAI